jgi:histidine phosphotransfer protein HptB
MSQPTIDRATLDELKDTAGAEFVQELIDTFLADAPLLLRSLRSAYSARDADAFRRAAHSLKSNSNTFGAKTLGALSRDVELSGLDAALAANGASLDALEIEYSRVAVALAELRNA